MLLGSGHASIANQLKEKVVLHGEDLPGAKLHAPLLIGLFFFMATQMFFIGLLGEYIGAVLTHVRNVPHVIESERINLDPP
jgi:hypothetical protein